MKQLYKNYGTNKKPIMDGFNNIVTQMVARTIRDFYKKEFDQFLENNKYKIKPRSISLAKLSEYVEEFCNDFYKGTLKTLFSFEDLKVEFIQQMILLLYLPLAKSLDEEINQEDIEKNGNKKGAFFFKELKA